MFIINVIFGIFLMVLLIYKKFDEFLITSLIFFYYLVQSNKTQSEYFSNENIQNAYSMLNSKKLIVGSLKVNNGATIGGVQFNCSRLNFVNSEGSSDGVMRNSEEINTALQKIIIPKGIVHSEEYLNFINMTRSDVNMNHNNPLFQLNIPNKSILSGVTVGDNNSISIIAPKPSIVNTFTANVEETVISNNVNIPMIVPIQSVISEEIFNNPQSRASQELTQKIISYRPPMPEIPLPNQKSTICTLPIVQK